MLHALAGGAGSTARKERMEYLRRIAEWGSALGIPPAVLARLGLSALVVLGYVVARRLSRRLASRRIGDPSSRYQVVKFTGYLFGFIAFALLLRIWLQGVTGFATYLGLLSAGVAVALQDPLINLAGWFYILLRRPLEVGDRIQIGAHAGDVVGGCPRTC